MAPHYWLKAVAGKRLAQAFPDLKVIMVIRDPVDRAYSAYNMYQKNKRFESYTRQSFAKTLALEKVGVDVKFASERGLQQTSSAIPEEF